MALVGLSQAAKLIGRNQSTVHRAMKTGRLSFTVDDAGGRRIDTTELDRVFGIKAQLAQPVQSHAAQGPEMAALQRLLDDREATIRDLRTRLDREVEERRQLIAVLTDRRPWWKRWLR